MRHLIGQAKMFSARKERKSLDIEKERIENIMSCNELMAKKKKLRQLGRTPK